MQKSRYRKFILINCCLLPLLLPTFCHAQQKNLPLNKGWDLRLEEQLNKIDKSDTAKSKTGSIHTNFHPFIESFAGDLDSYIRSNFDPLALYKNKKAPLWYRKIKRENLLIVKDTANKFYLTVDPLFDLQIGEDLKDRYHQRCFNNTRGILIRADAGKKFSFESTFYENQSAFVSYIDTFNRRNAVVPGQGRWKDFKPDPSDKRKVSYDYAMASGYISFAPNNHLNIQAGHGKHFIGDGYRSLLLSDNSFNYPFVRITTSFGKFQYTNLYAVFMNFSTGAIPLGTERLFQKKVGNFQNLSWNAHKRVQVGLFQATISEGTDYRNKLDVDASFFDPIIFGNAIQYGLHGTYNVLLGATLKLKITNTISAYGQLMVDDVSKNGPQSVASKHGFQLGAKYFNAFKVKDLYLQAECNIVRPFTYSKDSVNEAYVHYNQALAHPLGANFREFNGKISYRFGDFFVAYQLTYATIGQDSLGRFYGKNIFQSSSNATLAPNASSFLQNQGRPRTLQYNDLKIGYLINPATNMNIVLGITNRQFSGKTFKSYSHFVYVGIRTSLSNHYYDF